MASRGTVTARRLRGGEVAFRADFRDSTGARRKPTLGRAWVVEAGDALAARPRRRRTGPPVPPPSVTTDGTTWVERGDREARGDALLVAEAWEALDAAREAREAELAAEAERSVRDDLTGRTVGALAERWATWYAGDGGDYGVRPYTAANARRYAGRLARELGEETRVEDVTTARLRETILTMRSRRRGPDGERPLLKPAGRKNYVDASKSMFAHAVHELGWIADDPAAADLLRPKGERRRRRATLADADVDDLRDLEYLEPDVLWRVVALLRSGDYGANPRDRTRVLDAGLVGAMGLLGLRPGEAQALRNRDVDLRAGTVTVRRVYYDEPSLPPERRTGPPKSGRPRTLDLPDELRALLPQHRHGGPDGLLFMPSPFRPAVVADRGSLRERFNAAQDRLGIAPRRELRQLRHSFAVAHARSGLYSLAELQAMMGHQDPKTTLRYSRFVPADRARRRASAMPMPEGLRLGA